MGTIGGDICHGDPANDFPAVMLALNATFEVTSAKGKRTIKAQELKIDIKEILSYSICKKWGPYRMVECY